MRKDMHKFVPRWQFVECDDARIALLAENERLRGALEDIASTKSRPMLDPYNCEERLRRMAREAINV